MAYDPENNPYIPGDPYSYDLEWIVAQVKRLDTAVSSIDQKIKDAVLQALNSYMPVYYATAADLQASSQAAGTLAIIEGFYAAGDGGSNLYFITDDYDDIINADFYLTFTEPNKWALPVLLKEHVTPEMYGAVGDGVADDTTAVQDAIDSGKVVVAINSYKITSPVSLNGNTDVYFFKELNYTGAGFAIVATNSRNYLYIKELITNGSGLKISNADWHSWYNVIEIRKLTYTNTAVELSGTGDYGISFNIIKIGETLTSNTVDSKVLYAHNDSLTGFVTENEFTCLSMQAYTGIVCNSIETLRVKRIDVESCTNGISLTNCRFCTFDAVRTMETITGYYAILEQVVDGCKFNFDYVPILKIDISDHTDGFCEFYGYVVKNIGNIRVSDMYKVVKGFGSYKVGQLINEAQALFNPTDSINPCYVGYNSSESVNCLPLQVYGGSLATTYILRKEYYDVKSAARGTPITFTKFDGAITIEDEAGNQIFSTNDTPVSFGKSIVYQCVGYNSYQNKYKWTTTVI